MERIQATMTINNFFMDDITGNNVLEKIIDNLKLGLLEKLYFERLKGKDNEFFSISFRNLYWDDFRINQEIDKDLRIVNGLYKNPIPSKQAFIDRQEAYEMIREKKPFDIVLERKTLEDLPYFKPL